MQRVISIVAVVGTLGALLVTAGAAAAATPASAPASAAATVTAAAATDSIAWGPCSESDLQAAGAQCGYVSVPLSYSDPTGPQIQIAVSRIEHTSSAADYQGVIITNPGGPGGSGLDLNTYLIPVLQQEGFTAAADDYDWIGFDPRGVGSSVPAISCEPNYLGPDRPNYVPWTSSLLDTWEARSEGYASACASQNAEQTQLLSNMTTVDNADDINSIREALGVSQITYYGFSWGTDLGQTYATLFPHTLRRLILDSNVNMTRPGFDDFNLDQDGPFNTNEDKWFAWLAKYNDVYHLGATQNAVETLFYNTEASLENDPAGGIVGPDEWADTFEDAAYYEETWVEWGQVFSDYVNADNTSELVALYDSVDEPGNDNELAVYLSVLCTDSAWPTNWSTWTSSSWAVFKTAPFLTWNNTWFNAPCQSWPVKGGPLFKVNGDAVNSALLIDETGDAATPFGGSLVTRRLFPNSVLLAEPGGTSHADSLSGDLCVDGTIASYLETGQLPTRKPRALWDKTCAPIPVPVPPSSTSAADAARSAAALVLARQGQAAGVSQLPAVRSS
jgi:pimeloyl-ACP methyl ester carboxylesterase